ncbi:hypothetical protein ACWGQ5_41720 [Streptomyces sp. NPDC055722]
MIHLSADGHCRPLSLIVTAEQGADCTQFVPVLEKTRDPRSGWEAPQEAGRRRGGQGLQQRPLPRLPAPPGHPAHDRGERTPQSATIYLAGLHIAGIFLWSAR